MHESWPLPTLAFLAGVALIVAIVVWLASKPRQQRERNEIRELNARVHNSPANRSGVDSHHGGTS